MTRLQISASRVSPRKRIPLDNPPPHAIMPLMSGISFLVDERGQKTAVMIDLKRYARVWEDFYDTLLATSRRDEPRESLDEVRRRLKRRKPVHG